MELSNNNSLKPRLKTISDFVLDIAAKKEKIGTLRLIDVGTDHAKLPIYLVKEGICGFVYASDIKEQPLKRAKINLDEAGLSEDKIQLVLSNGLNCPYRDYDCVVVAGMGGLNIADILVNAPRKDVPFILNPMTSIEDLRGWLYDNRFEIVSEKAVYSSNKYYVIMSVIYSGRKRKYQVWEKYYSSDLRRRYCEDETTKRFFVSFRKKMTKIVNCRKESNQTGREYDEAVSVLENLNELIGE